jgi:hypothetical protein
VKRNPFADSDVQKKLHDQLCIGDIPWFLQRQLQTNQCNGFSVHGWHFELHMCVIFKIQCL